MASIKISPSILSADFARLGEQVEQAEAAGADEIHFDVMDGRFVPGITFGFVILEAVRKHTQLPIDVHMMVDDPVRFVPEYADLPGLTMTVHVEACPDLTGTIEAIGAAGMRPAITLNPATPLSEIADALPLVDRVLVMTVVPGAGGQPFMDEVLPKIVELREIARAHNGLEIAVDGGIKADTAPRAVAAGVTTLISGSGVFGHPDGIAGGIRALRQAVEGL
ncbi:MAG: ribulose-phosphate 3-epimerase [Chloroflexi bacterium]|nr:ribulose-phosphate 3-epimerase [Chloroflexota bacterium]